MANKINRTDIYPNTTPADDDFVLGVDVSDTGNDANGEVVTFTIADILSTPHNHTKSNISDFNEADYATAAQGAKADSALQSGNIGISVQAYDAGLQSISNLTTAADKILYTTAADTYATTDLTSFARTLLDDADAATARTTLGAAGLASPAFTGSPTAPTQPAGDNSTKLATTGYVDAAAGGLDFIATSDAGVVGGGLSAVSFTAFDATKYDAYLFVIQNVLPATDGVSFLVRTSTDSGSTYDSGASDYEVDIRINGAALGSTTTSGYLSNLTDMGNAANEDYSGTLWVLGPHLSKYTRMVLQGSYTNDAGVRRNVHGANYRASAADVDAIQFFMSSGNVLTGTVTMYGLKNS